MKCKTFLFCYLNSVFNNGSRFVLFSHCIVIPTCSSSMYLRCKLFLRICFLGKAVTNWLINYNKIMLKTINNKNKKMFLREEFWDNLSDLESDGSITSSQTIVNPVFCITEKRSIRTKRTIQFLKIITKKGHLQQVMAVSNYFSLN